jgi:SOS-response transcriptional repressor LexA
MIPTLTDGTIVAVDRTRRDPREANGRIVCAQSEGGCAIKRWRVTGSHVILESDNPAYAPIVLEPDEVDAGALLGVVIWAWVDLR